MDALAFILVPVYTKGNERTLIHQNGAILGLWVKSEGSFFDINFRKTDMFVKFLLSYSTLTNQHPILHLAESLGFLVDLELHRQEEKQWL